MLLFIVFFPLLGFLTVFLLGRFLGKLGSAFTTLFFLFLSLLLANYFFFSNILTTGDTFIITLEDWISIGTFNVSWVFVFDTLALLMLSMISFISFLVHLYSVEYMGQDPHFPRFMSFLSLFTFFMFILVTAGNYVQLFVGWEGVGLCSYLLINFWYTRINANLAAIKAVLVNRVGDFGIMFAIVLLYYYFGTLDFVVLSLVADAYFSFFIDFLGFRLPVADLICFFILLGAVGKSAQLGLHTWLPDAMEGPTPVSALIHAATMVTAGVFVLVRSSFLFDVAPYALALVAVIGAMTALFASLTGAFQFDLKRIIAYSTCSQLGYMVFSCGLAHYNLAMFHLINHAFFKALLFLSAGSVIHAFSDEQDIRRISGLFNYMPLTYVAMLVGNFALIGFPFFSGFYSKDLIIETALVSYKSIFVFAAILALSAAFFTAYYSFKALYLCFYSEPRVVSTYFTFVHEPSFFMLFPLVLLTLFSLMFGEVSQDAFLSSSFWQNTISEINVKSYYTLQEFLLPLFKNMSLFFTLMGLIISFISFRYTTSGLVLRLRSFYYIFVKKVWFDNLYNRVIVKPLLSLAYYGTFKSIDKGILELITVRSIFNIVTQIIRSIGALQSGYIFNYVMLSFVALVAFCFIIYL